MFNKCLDGKILTVTRKKCFQQKKLSFLKVSKNPLPQQLVITLSFKVSFLFFFSLNKDLNWLKSLLNKANLLYITMKFYVKTTNLIMKIIEKNYKKNIY